MSNSALRYQDNYQPRSKRKPRKTRDEKVVEGVFEVKPKFQEEREETVKRRPLRAMTAKQQHYLDLLNDPNIRIIIATGLFGTGKTYLPSALAADLMRTGGISKTIVARPYVQTGKSSGSKPGSTLQKMYPYIRTMLDTMQQRMGYAAYKIALNDGEGGAIEVQEFESIRGRSFDDACFVIVDEIQQATPEEVLSVVTRVSDKAKLILCGDLQQRDISGESGLRWFLEFAQRNNLEGVGIVDFNEVEDIVRGGVVKGIAVGLMKDLQKGIKTPQSK